MNHNERPHTLHATLDTGGALWGRLECPYEDLGLDRPCRLLPENPEPADGCYVVQWYAELGMELWGEETELDGSTFPLAVAWDDPTCDGPTLRLWKPADVATGG